MEIRFSVQQLRVVICAPKLGRLGRKNTFSAKFHDKYLVCQLPMMLKITVSMQHCRFALKISRDLHTISLVTREFSLEGTLN